MKTKLLGILALCLGVAYAAQAQFRIGTTDYPTLSAAVAAVPTTGIPTTIEATMNHSMTTAVTVNSGQHIVIEKRGRDIYTQTQRSTSYVFDHGTK